MILNRAARYGELGLWIRSVYRKLFLAQKIFAVVRPDDRSGRHSHLYIPDTVSLPVRFIKEPTKTPLGTPGNLLPDEGITVVRTKCIVKCIGELTEDDLRGTAPDTATPELVRYHIATIYNTELPTRDAIVTIWRFEYAPNALE